MDVTVYTPKDSYHKTPYLLIGTGPANKGVIAQTGIEEHRVKIICHYVPEELGQTNWRKGLVTNYLNSIWAPFNGSITLSN